MPIHDFTLDNPGSSNPCNSSFSGSQEVCLPRKPIANKGISPQTNMDSPLNYAPEEVREVATRGFFTLDDGLKNWLSGIKIPTLDNYKIASVHVVNQDRSILSWAQEFIDGRVSLPIISIQRTSWSFDQSQYTPPYVSVREEFLDNTLRKKRAIYRPIPFKVEYSCYVWAQFKSDAEHIDSSIIRRCNPLGEFTVEDEYYSQIARIKHTGTNDNSDIDIVKDRAKVIYNLSFSLEYSLPINEKIVPTVLGHVASVKESPVGEIFDVYRIDDF